MTGDLVTAILMSNISYLESVVAEVHAECLRNLRKGHSHGEGQTRAQDLLSVFQGLHKHEHKRDSCVNHSEAQNRRDREGIHTLRQHLVTGGPW